MNTEVGAQTILGIRQFHGCGNGRAFTLVEVLVVSGIVSLLAAIVMPAGQQAARHARAVACQSRLRQWGLGFSLFLDEREDAIINPSTDVWEPFWGRYCDRPKGLLLCPMATRHESNPNDPLAAYRETIEASLGSRLTAWRIPFPTPATVEPGTLFGSYGQNSGGFPFLDPRINKSCRFDRSNIPVLLDCMSLYSWAQTSDEPPAFEDQVTIPGDIKRWCMDRHAGGINSLFLDWSVRKVRLKELWTLKWSPWFDTRGPWTAAGGVQPEDWPAWMRAFKDY